MRSTRSFSYLLLVVLLCFAPSTNFDVVAGYIFTTPPQVPRKYMFTLEKAGRSDKYRETPQNSAEPLLTVGDMT